MFDYGPATVERFELEGAQYILTDKEVFEYDALRRVVSVTKSGSDSSCTVTAYDYGQSGRISSYPLAVSRQW